MIVSLITNLVQVKMFIECKPCRFPIYYFHTRQHFKAELFRAHQVKLAILYSACLFVNIIRRRNPNIHHSFPEISRCKRCSIYFVYFESHRIAEILMNILYHYTLYIYLKLNIFQMISIAYLLHLIWLILPAVLLLPVALLTAFVILCKVLPDCITLSDYGTKYSSKIVI